MNSQINDTGSQAESKQDRERLGRLFALSSATFLGLNTTLARLAYEGGTNPATVVFLRLLLTSVAVGILIAVVRRRFTLPRKAILPIFGVGVSVVFQGAAYLSSIAFIPVGLAVLLFYTYPLMVAAASRVIDKQKIAPGRMVALLAAFAGISLAVGPSFAVLDWRGIVLALMGGFGVMSIFMFSASALKHVDSLSVSFYSNVFALPLIVVTMSFMGGYQAPVTGQAQAALFGVCLLYALAIVMQYAAIHAIGKTQTALLSNLEPLISITAAALLLGESLSGLQYLGGLIVVTALVVSDWMAKRSIGDEK